MALTTDLIARTRDLLAEAGADFYDDALEIMPALNEGRLDLFSGLDALPMTFSDTVTIDAEGVATAPCPGLLESYIEVRYDGVPLTPLTAQEVGPYSILEAGTPTHYCPEFLTDGGTELMRLYPTPTSEGTVAMTYYAYPPELVNSADPALVVDPTWHVAHHFAVCYFAAARLMPKDNLREQADRMQSRYDEQKAAYKRWLRARLAYRPSTTATVALPATFDMNRR